MILFIFLSQKSVTKRSLPVPAAFIAPSGTVMLPAQKVISIHFRWPQATACLRGHRGLVINRQYDPARICFYDIPYMIICFSDYIFRSFTDDKYLILIII